MLLIVRHGKAEPQAPSGSDHDRALLPQGEEQAAWLGRALQARGCVPALILASPFRRAMETARLLNQFLRAPLELAAELQCDEPVSGMLALIQQHHPLRQPLMLVGHNPQLSRLASLLISGPAASEVELATGQAALIDVPGGDCIGSGRLLDLLRCED